MRLLQRGSHSSEQRSQTASKRLGSSYLVAIRSCHSYREQTTQHTCQVPGNRKADVGKGILKLCSRGLQGRPPHTPGLLQDMGLGAIKGSIIFWGYTVARPSKGWAARLLTHHSEARNMETIRAGVGFPTHLSRGSQSPCISRDDTDQEAGPPLRVNQKLQADSQHQQA